MKIIAQNKKAHFEYDLLENYEAGLVLVGDEIKSVRLGKVSLIGSFAKIFMFHGKPELWLVNAHIETTGKDPTRSRKLLMHKTEITKLIGKIQEKGLTLIPTKLYLKNGRAKVEVALGRGRKLHDKREAIKLREIDRSLKN
jgi:SsrA-binding protein